jgi:hypothetical protein
MDAQQVTFFELKTRVAFERKPWLRHLHAQLLSFGGEAVVLWGGSDDEETSPNAPNEDGHRIKTFGTIRSSGFRPRWLL